MASSTAAGCSTDRSCLCGTVNAPSPPPVSAQSSQHASNTAKCKICRTKPKFCFLRGQRSFDLGKQGPSSGGYVLVSAAPTRSKEAEAVRATSRATPQARRARSAERFEGLRINERPAAGLPRQTSLQMPVPSIGTSSDRPPEYVYPELPPISSPPPPYEVAVGKMGHPPSYDEYLAQRLQQKLVTKPAPTPPPLPPRNPTKPLPMRNPSPQTRWSLQPSSTLASHSQQQQTFCSCSKCKSGSVSGRGGGLRVDLPVQQEGMMTARGLAEAQRDLRVMLPPEIAQQSTSSHEHCPCSKCQSRYGAYDDSNGNNDLMFSLDSTPALQGVLSDGLVCSVM